MPFDRYPVTQPEEGTYPSKALRNNAKGTYLDKEALERFKIREICEGWGNYRDAAEYVEHYLQLHFLLLTASGGKTIAPCSLTTHTLLPHGSRAATTS